MGPKPEKGTDPFYRFLGTWAIIESPDEPRKLKAVNRENFEAEFGRAVSEVEERDKLANIVKVFSAVLIVIGVFLIAYGWFKWHANHAIYIKMLNDEIENRLKS